MLLQTKGWTAVVLLSLALGIGANAALFTGVNGLLLRTVSVPHPETLVRLRYTGKNDMRRSSNGYGFSGKNAAGEDVRETTSYPVFQALRAANQSLTDIAAMAPIGNVNVIVDGKAELANALLASGNYFQVLGINPEIGRMMTLDDDSGGAAPIAVISHAFWQKRFGGQPGVLGRSITVNNTVVTIIGVTPASFGGVQSLTETVHDITLPVTYDSLFTANGAANPRIKDGTWWWLQMVGRLKPGVTIQQVKGNLEGTFQGASRDGWMAYYNSITDQDRGLARNQNRTAVPHLEVDSAGRGIYEVDSDTLKSATILSVVVGLMLVIVCANVANLLLSRAASRQREISVRLSLGATRSRLVRQLLTESLLLAFLGGGLGVLVGYWSRQLLPFADKAPMDWRVFGFVAAVCLLTGVAFGFVPALRTTRVDLAGSMKDGGRSVTRSRTLLTKGLLVVQVAISLVVLIGAGLFLRTLQNLRNVNVGFNTRNLVVFTMSARLAAYDATRAGTLNDRIQEAVKALPGVRAVSRSTSVFLSGNVSQTGMFVKDKNQGKAMDLWSMTVSPEFFETMEIPLVRGRLFDVRDTLPKAPLVAVINETVARANFPGEDPLGMHFGNSAETTGDIEIIGIVRDVKYANVRDAAPPTGFRPFPQQSAANATFAVRVGGDPEAMTKTIRETVQRVDSNVPILRMTTQSQLVEGRFQQERFFAMAYLLFGGLALLLASIGLFGLMSYSVSRRTNEIGIRVALGAQKTDVVGMVLRESLVMVGIGIVIGVGGALWAGRLVTKMLFGLAPNDLLSVLLAIGVMLAVSLLAAYLPARRASRVDPMTALHYE